MRKPLWLKARLGVGEHFRDVKGTLERFGLHTVCQEAGCPNLGECWGRGTATFMILGDVCTRACRFCGVKSGPPSPPEINEPRQVAEAAKALSLSYCVVTSVSRDDLPDGGAGHFAATVRAIREICPDTLIEVLIPDFEGSRNSLRTVIEAEPDLIGHNVETAARLAPGVRDRRTSYHRSLALLKGVKEIEPEARTKSGLMVGLGETEGEVLATMQDLRDAECDILTVGQYLQPSKECLPVAEYVHPEKFKKYREIGEAMGFRSVAAGPFVRSSYLSDQFYEQVREPSEALRAE